MQHLYKIGIERTENVTHLTIQGYIQEIRRRGKYTTVTNQDARNYPENRPDYGKQVSDVTINNYLRNLIVFFNWCVDEDIPVSYTHLDVYKRQVCQDCFPKWRLSATGLKNFPSA